MDGRGYLIKLFFVSKGLAAIPVSLFFSPEHRKGFDKYVRFCFVKVTQFTVSLVSLVSLMSFTCLANYSLSVYEGEFHPGCSRGHLKKVE